MPAVVHTLFFSGLIAIAAAVIIERISLKIPLAFRPAVRKTGESYDDEDGYTLVEHSVVTRGRGRIVRMFEDRFGIQHVVLLWGPIARLPYQVLRWFFYQRTRTRPKGRGNDFDVLIESWSIFPVTHAHLVGFPEVFPSDWIDLRGARVVEMYEGDKKVMFGARDLDTWRHHDCPFLMPAVDAD